MENLQNEIWKGIKGYEGLYMVSNMGRIKSLARICIKKNGKPQPMKEMILKYNKSTGYCSVALCNKFHIKTRLLAHRLVAFAFLDNLDSRPEVNHIDGDKNNNSLQNLEWATRLENIQHSIKNNLRSSVGANNANSKLTEADAIEIKIMLHGKTPIKHVASKFKMSYNMIWLINKGLNWKNISSPENKQSYANIGS